MNQTIETVNPTTEKLEQAIEVLKRIGADRLGKESAALQQALPQFLKDNVDEASPFVPYYGLTMGIQLGVALSALAFAENELKGKK